MQTWIAYAVDPAAGPVDLSEAIARVEERENRLRVVAPRVRRVSAETTGMVLWDREDSPFLWPAWAQHGPRTVCSLYLPLGFSGLRRGGDLNRVALSLGEELRRSPGRIDEITPPFVCACLDTTAQSLDIFTDVIGSGRVFEVKTADGWVWSNRSLAALMFAGIPPHSDVRGWSHSAVADEFFGDTTPFQGVRSVGPATRIRWDGRRGRRRVEAVDTAASWVPGISGEQAVDSEVSGELAEAAAGHLTDAAASLAAVYQGTPIVDLSGGRDSRLVAAAFIAADVPCVLHSHDAVPGDLDTALDLVELLPRRVEHQVRTLAARSPTAQPAPIEALDRATRWHRYAEGLRPCSYLYGVAPASIDADTRLVIGGVGGEAAHGYFYPGDLDALLRVSTDVRLDRLASRILSRQAPVAGAAPQAVAEVREHVRGVLRRVSDLGVGGAAVLDFYYVLERMRRWGTTAERIGTVSPLLSSQFIRAALSLSSAQRRTNVLHRAVTRLLVPQWADVPYFPGEVAQSPHAAIRATRRSRVRRLGAAVDADAIEAMFAARGPWSGAFDVPVMQALWCRSVAGETSAREERVLQSALWRGTFEDMLAVERGGPRRGSAGSSGLPAYRAPHRPGLRSSTRHPVPLTPSRHCVAPVPPKPSQPRPCGSRLARLDPVCGSGACDGPGLATRLDARLRRAGSPCLVACAARRC